MQQQLVCYEGFLQRLRVAHRAIEASAEEYEQRLRAYQRLGTRVKQLQQARLRIGVARCPVLHASTLSIACYCIVVLAPSNVTARLLCDRGPLLAQALQSTSLLVFRWPLNFRTLTTSSWLLVWASLPSVTLARLCK